MNVKSWSRSVSDRFEGFDYKLEMRGLTPGEREDGNICYPRTARVGRLIAPNNFRDVPDIDLTPNSRHGGQRLD
jgi:hypothetical protein